MTEKRVGAAKFKEQCLAMLDDLAPEGIIITKHGRPVARVVPILSDPAELIGRLRGKLHIRGDIVSTGAHWDAQS